MMKVENDHKGRPCEGGDGLRVRSVQKDWTTQGVFACCPSINWHNFFRLQ